MKNSSHIRFNRKSILNNLQNTVWPIFEHAVRIFATIFIGVLVARYLGPSNYGILNFYIALFAIIACIPRLGLDDVLIKNIVLFPKKRRTLLFTGFVMKFSMAIITILLITIVINFSDFNNDSYYIYILLPSLIFQSFEVVDFFFKAQVLSKISSICKLFQLILSSIIKIFLIIEEADLIWFIVILTFDAISLGVFYLIAYKLFTKNRFFNHFDFRISIDLLKESLPLMFSIIFVIAYMRIDQIMINVMIGSYDVGIYSAAVGLSEAFYFIPMIITTSLFPAILSSKQINLATYKESLTLLYTILTWLSIFIILIISFSGEILISILFGSEYIKSASVLIIHIWSFLFVSFGVTSGRYLLAEGYTKSIFFRALMGCILNIILNFYLIPVYGIEGAAMATLISQFFSNFVYDFFDKNLHNQIPLKIKSIFSPMLLVEPLKEIFRAIMGKDSKNSLNNNE